MSPEIAMTDGVKRKSNRFDVGLRGRPLLVAITACCALGFCLVGYDNGVMGGLIEGAAFKRTFNNPSPGTIGDIVSLYEIGCFIGALASFSIGTPLGRRGTILLGTAILEVGAIFQGAASSVGVMIAGRIIGGVGMGLINSTVPMMLAECSPAKSDGIWSRGKLVGIALTVLNFGIVLSYWVDYGFSFSGLQGSVIWRFPILMQTVLIVALATLALIVPDTPRWYVSRGRDCEAIDVLARLREADTKLGKADPMDADVQMQFHHIQQAFIHETEAAASAAAHHQGSYLSAFFYLLSPGGGGKDDSIRSRRRWLLACFIQAAQQLGGINAIIYYSASLFKVSIELSDQQSALLAGFLNMVLIVGSTTSIFLVDRVGRKPLLLSCISLMAVVLAAQAGFIKQVEDGVASRNVVNAAVTMLFLFELFFSIGFQATVWLIPAEVLPLKIRTKGSALSTATNWLCNFIVVKATPLMIRNIGWRTYVVFAVLNFCWLPVIAIFLPETKGLTLEQVDEVFTVDSWKLEDDGEAGRGQNGDDEGDDKSSQDKNKTVLTGAAAAASGGKTGATGYVLTRTATVDAVVPAAAVAATPAAGATQA